MSRNFLQVGMEEDYPRTLLELERRFSTEQACREYLFDLRWPDGFRCPRCEAGKSWALQSGRVQCAGCGYQVSMTAGTVFQDTRTPLTVWFRAMWWLTSQKNGVSALALQRVLGWGSYQKAWTCLHKLRHAMIRPGRERLAGVVEVDESYLGGDEQGVHGRHIVGKALVVVAAEEDGRGIGRIRLRHIPDASSARLTPFIEDSIEPGSTVHTDGWYGYLPLRTAAYQHRISNQKGHPERASELLPRVHQVFSLLNRWLLGTHQGSVAGEHLQDYLNEFAFRFNRRKSRSRGKLAAAGRRNRTNNLQTDCGLGHQTEIAQNTTCWGNLSQMDNQFLQLLFGNQPEALSTVTVFCVPR